MSRWSSVLPAPVAEAAPEDGAGRAPRLRGAPRSPLPARPQRRWWVEIALVTGLGLGIRLATVLGRPNRKPGGDGYYYHYAANLLVEGYGFIDPWKYYLGHPKHQLVQTADWPPLFVWVLAMVAVVGFKSFFAQRVWCCVVGAAAVLVCGLAGREVAGRRAGLIAAFLAALYPNLWMSDELALSEALTPLLIALVLWCTFRFWKRPTYGRMVALGLSLGVAILGRDELALLIPLVLIPMALLTKARVRRRLALAGVGTLTALTVVAPWVGYNMDRFQDPTFVSTGFGVTLASANCDITWAGRYEGYWSLQCSLKAPIKQNVDKSVQSAEAEAYGVHYIRSHLHRLVPVELARLGRAFGAFHPVWQVWLDYYVETRPYHWALAGLGMYYALAALSVGGTVVLRRRRVPVSPLWAVGVVVAVVALVTFGQTRFRTPFEVSLVVMAAVALDWVWGWLRGTGAPPDTVHGPPRHLLEAAPPEPGAPAAPLAT